jgi:hypothetical protein
MNRVQALTLAAIVAITASVFAQAPAGQQPGSRGQAPPPITNLQVLPKDIARPELIEIMRGFTGDLGKPAASVTKIQCGTCDRGEAIPKYELPPPPAPAAPGGAAAPGQ